MFSFNDQEKTQFKNDFVCEGEKVACTLKGDRLAGRALYAATWGILLAPVVFHLYSVWLLIWLRISGEYLNWHGKERVRAAWRANLIVLSGALACASLLTLSAVFHLADTITGIVFAVIVGAWSLLVVASNLTFVVLKIRQTSAGREREMKQEREFEQERQRRKQCAHAWHFAPLMGVRLTMQPGHSPPSGQMVCSKCGAIGSTVW